MTRCEHIASYERTSRVIFFILIVLGPLTVASLWNKGAYSLNGDRFKALCIGVFMVELGFGGGYFLSFVHKRIWQRWARRCAEGEAPRTTTLAIQRGWQFANTAAFIVVVVSTTTFSIDGSDLSLLAAPACFGTLLGFISWRRNREEGSWSRRQCESEERATILHEALDEARRNPEAQKQVRPGTPESRDFETCLYNLRARRDAGELSDDDYDVEHLALYAKFNRITHAEHARLYDKLQKRSLTPPQHPRPTSRTRPG